jgi:type IV pilus assembly protein PilB
MAFRNKRLGQVLIELGQITEGQLADALAQQKQSGQRLGQILIEKNYITEDVLQQSLSKMLDIPFVDLDTVRIDPGMSEILPEAMMTSNLLVPIRKEGNVLTIAIYDPLDLEAIKSVSVYTKMKVQCVLARSDRIRQAIGRIFSTTQAFAAAKALHNVSAAEITDESDSDQPIIRFVNNMLEHAVQRRASDIHIEPLENSMRIRFRIYGQLVPYTETGIELHSSVVSRIKYICGMNIAEHRLPQDGRITHRVAGQEIDLRVSVISSVFGEKIVMRITTALSMELNKHSIGFTPSNLTKFERLIQGAHGVVLLTGPTGSGKSTTLYTAIKEIMTDDINVTTVEDPVEMVIPGITQVEVNAKAGLTFAACLRSILRQDPDVIMIGEIRDRETADIAISAAITGHTVFSTLHTYDSPSAVVRLIEMGLPSYLLASAISGVISQRLVRKICPFCAEEYMATPEELLSVGYHSDQPVKLRRGKGCSACSGTGYIGRQAVHEVMIVTSKIKQAIHEARSTDEIRAVAIEQGMESLMDNARQIMLEGVTSLSEVFKLYAAEMFGE